MGATVESLPAKAPGLRSSGLRRHLTLYDRGSRLRVEPDGSVRSFYSLQEARALFGVERVAFYKVQAGIVVHAQRPDWSFRLSPRSVQITGRIFDGVEVAQSLEFHRGKSLGYLRRVRLKNGSQAPIRLRVIGLFDPTAAHFEGPSPVWGSLGVNAFNRESHVAMDEVSDPPSARVVGSTPAPSKFYMTTSVSRAMELLSTGELPDKTAGMSGQVIVMSSHEVELAPGESREVAYAFIYSPGKLEDALSEFGRINAEEQPSQQSRPLLACSEREVTEAAAWALPQADAGQFAGDPLDRYEVLGTLGHFERGPVTKILEGTKSALRKDGSLPHSQDPSRPGVLETAVFLGAAAGFLLAAQDKKLARAHYPTLKKLAGYLLAASKDYTVVLDPSLPQGWRRHLGRGYPTGEVPEVSLAVASALAAASQLGRMLKSDDASKFRERSEMVSDRVRKKLVDERGFLALCRDSSGRLRSDDTADMAVAVYRHPFMPSAEQAAAHRLLEKDFDTPYGPRCVPTSNQVYFNGAYGMGQLGGVWTRATLAHAMVCYGAGLPGIGSLALGKVARLVTDDAVKLGGSPGEFPPWVDADGRAIREDEADPVAAARFVQVLLEGELGLATGSDGASIAPAASSGLSWLLASDFWAGETFSVFLGRGGNRSHLFFAGGKLASKGGTRYSKCERIDIPVKGVFGVSFNSPGQIICLGNSTSATARFTASFPPRAADLARHLSTPLEEYDPSRGGWNKTGSLRVSPTMTFEASLGPNEWKVFRVSSA